MKNTVLFFLILLITPSGVQASKIDMNQLALEAIAEMPIEGGYELSELPAKRLEESFSFVLPADLSVDPFLATPSYCTTATYLIFYKILKRYWDISGINPAKELLLKIKPQMEKDGFKIWGRWNSNGPGAAKFVFDSMIGTNFDDVKIARPGDFIKMFWNDKIGKLEKGHTGIFLGVSIENGIQMIRFWASSKSTQGFGERLIPLSEAKKILFTRIDKPENFRRIMDIPENDPFLASMLTLESNWNELKRVSGF